MLYFFIAPLLAFSENAIVSSLVIFKLFQFISLGVYGYFGYRISKKISSLFTGLWKIIPIFGYVLLWRDMHLFKKQAISSDGQKSSKEQSLNEENAGSKLKERKRKIHERIYIFFLVLAIISFIDMATRSLVSINKEIGIFGFLIIGITQNPIIISISAILLDFGLFFLIIALLERRTHKKLQKDSQIITITNNKSSAQKENYPPCKKSKLTDAFIKKLRHLKSSKAGLIILIILFFGILFYWYGIRPSMIKSHCAKQAKKNVLKGERRTMEVYDNYYTICIRENGL
jgi:hypothetical protein